LLGTSKNEIADEKMPAPQAKIVGENSSPHSCQRGEAEVDAVEIGKEIRQHQKRNETPRNGTDRRGLDFAFCDAGRAVW